MSIKQVQKFIKGGVEKGAYVFINDAYINVLTTSKDIHLVDNIMNGRNLFEYILWSLNFFQNHVEKGGLVVDESMLDNPIHLDNGRIVRIVGTLENPQIEVGVSGEYMQSLFSVKARRVKGELQPDEFEMQRVTEFDCKELCEGAKKFISTVTIETLNYLTEDKRYSILFTDVEYKAQADIYYFRVRTDIFRIMSPDTINGYGVKPLIYYFKLESKIQQDIYNYVCRHYRRIQTAVVNKYGTEYEYDELYAVLTDLGMGSYLPNNTTVAINRIEKAVEEINSKINLSLQVERVKKSNKVLGLKFSLEPNKERDVEFYGELVSKEKREQLNKVLTPSEPKQPKQPKGSSEQKLIDDSKPRVKKHGRRS